MRAPDEDFESYFPASPTFAPGSVLVIDDLGVGSKPRSLPNEQHCQVDEFDRLFGYPTNQPSPLQVSNEADEYERSFGIPTSPPGSTFLGSSGGYNASLANTHDISGSERSIASQVKSQTPMVAAPKEPLVFATLEQGVRCSGWIVRRRHVCFAKPSLFKTALLLMCVTGWLSSALLFWLWVHEEGRRRVLQPDRAIYRETTAFRIQKNERQPALIPAEPPAIAAAEPPVKNIGEARAVKDEEAVLHPRPAAAGQRRRRFVAPSQPNQPRDQVTLPAPPEIAALMASEQPRWVIDQGLIGNVVGRLLEPSKKPLGHKSIVRRLFSAPSKAGAKQ